jgi:hypothetical protein
MTTTFTTTAPPSDHPGAVRTGSTVLYGPFHCLTVHGGCDWCYAHGYITDPPPRCACGR